MKKKILLVLFLFMPFVVQAQNLITVGTGSKKIVVTNDSTISDIETVLGSAKIKTKSAFGGYAYTFYTDNNYSNHLYIETDSNNKIVNYGSVDKTYTTPKVNSCTYGSSYCSYKYSRLLVDKKTTGVVLLNDSDKSIADLLNIYKTNYPKDPKVFMGGMIKHAKVMLEKYYSYQGITNKLKFSDDLINYQLSLYDYDYTISDIIDSTSNKLSQDIVSFNNYNTEYNYQNLYSSHIINPLILVIYVNSLKDKINSDHYLVFDFNYKYKKLGIYSISENYKNLLLNNKLSQYQDDSSDEDKKINTKILQAMSLVNRNANDFDKANSILQYVHNGTYYHLKNMYQRMEKLLVENNAVCAGYNDSFTSLSSMLGLNCSYLVSSAQNHAMSMCKINGEWTYIDATKDTARSMTTNPEQYSRVNGIVFKDQETLSRVWTSFFTDGRASNVSYNPLPAGKNNSDKALYNIYFDNNYKYYTEYAYGDCKGLSDSKSLWCSYIYRENLSTGKSEKITGVLPKLESGNMNMVLDNNTIYYVENNGNNIYTMNTDGSNKKKYADVFALGIYMQDGVIYYVTDDKKIVKIKESVTWPKEGTYTSSNYSLKYVKNNNGISIIKVIGNGSNVPSGEINIPDSIDGVPVIGIGRNAFSLYKGTMEELTLPTNLLYIDESAFSGVNIKKITFNSKLKYLGIRAFAYNDSLTELNIPDNVSVIRGNAFLYDKNITKIKIGSGLKVLQNNLFDSNNSINSVEFSEGLEYVNNTLDNLRNVEKIEIPSTVLGINSSLDKMNTKYLIIHAKNMEYLNLTDIPSTMTIYLHGSSKTGELAKSKGISFVDLDKISNKVTLSKTSLNVYYSDTPETLTYTVEPAYLTDYTANWTSSNNNVVSVNSNGKLRYNASGSAVITLTLSNGLKATCNVKVTGIEANNLLVSKNNVKLSVGDTYQYKTLILPIDSTDDKTITWKSSNSNIVSVDSNGKITAKKNGSADISITNNGITKTSHVVVSDNYIIDTIKSVNYTGFMSYDLYNAKTKNNVELLLDYTNSNSNLIDNQFNVIDNSGGFAILTANDSTYGDNRNLVYVNGVISLSQGYGMFGDLTKDGVIDNKDIEKLASIIKNNKISDDDLLLADTDNNKKLDNKDLDTLFELISDDSFSTKKIDYYINASSTIEIAMGDYISVYNYITGLIDKSLPSIEWTSSDNSILKIISDEGEYATIVGMKKGTATLYAKSLDGVTKSIKVIVNEPILKIDEQEVVVEVGQTKSINISTNLNRARMSYNSSNASVIDVEFNGFREVYNFDKYVGSTQNFTESIKVTGLKIGNSKINIDFYGKSYSINVNVIAPVDLIKEIDTVSISGSSKIKVGSNSKLSASVSPSDSTYTTDVTWESSNENVVKITEDGVISGENVGTATITATSSNGVKSTYKVEVTEVEITKVTLSKTSLTMDVGDVNNLTYTINPTNTTMDNMVSWESSNNNVVIVENGKITAVGKGTATITVTTVNGKTATCSVKVNEPQYKKGDMNHNGRIDLKDIILLIKKYLGILDLEGNDLYIGDMNNNSKIDLKDIILLIKTYLGTS